MLCLHVSLGIVNYSTAYSPKNVTPRIGPSFYMTLCLFLSGAVTFQIQITKTYNATNLLEDIKGLYKIAGLKGQKVAFIFTYVLPSFPSPSIDKFHSFKSLSLIGSCQNNL